MKIRFKILVVLFVFSCNVNSFGQSFEGELTYKIEFDIETQKFGEIEITEEIMIEEMKKDGEFFDTITITLKGGDYIKEDNSRMKKRIIYKSDVNKIYTFQKDFEYVIITDGNKYNSLDLGTDAPKIEVIDSTKNIYDTECKLVKLSWGSLGDELYYFNSNFLEINPELFVNHNYEYLNAILKHSNSYPLEIIKSLSNFITVKMTLVNVSEGKVDASLFDVPKLKKAEKDYGELMLKITGSEVMKVKN